jgi:SAM-dependent methyltransferase
MSPDLAYTDERLVGIYDALNAGDHDWVFYERLIGTAPRLVADVGCGTGAFAVRLASAGHTVVAVDPAPAMLALARGRPGAPAVTWVDGDARDLPRSPSFDCATMMGHAFQCLLTDEVVGVTLTAIRSRLVPGGRMMFESRNPATRPWLRWQGPAGNGVAYSLVSVRPPLVTFDARYRVDGGELVGRSTLRFSSRAQIAAQLGAAGFTHVEWFGGWDGEPFDDETSPEIIAVAR